MSLSISAIRNQKILENPVADIASPGFRAIGSQYMRHSGWYPDLVTRLSARRNQFSNEIIHTRKPGGQWQDKANCVDDCCMKVFRKL
jgi:hypothetical protein